MHTTGKIHSRMTTDDIRAARLKRWNGRVRVTTDWVNLYYEPELYFPNGDCLVYLRQPGQSMRGPAFRVHASQLVVKGFRKLLDRSVARTFLHSAEDCSMPSCEGCDRSITRELYMPAPPNSDLDSTIDCHLVTRNFFAWLYNIPLTGRTLGVSLLMLKERIDEYRPTDVLVRNKSDIISFLEHHRYLDFRECTDHALAILQFAEELELEDLWIDAFTHSVGMSHSGLRSSVEYVHLSKSTKVLISKARQEMDVRLDQVSRSVATFFENDLSESFLSLPQAAREHFDRFRSFLQAYYIEQYGFWPPERFDDEAVKKRLYSSMYSDFRALYHHLVNPESTGLMAPNISTSGGVCTLQNIHAFDKRHHYEALPHPLPLLPAILNSDITPPSSSLRGSFSRRNKKADREMRNEASLQALINASRRDMSIMESLIVRRYSMFEQQSVLDDFENVSVVDGRKVRWILIYSILQTLISVMQAPQQVRNTDGLSYSLCCHPPKVMPWQTTFTEPSTKASSISDYRPKEIEPDNTYSHTSTTGSPTSSTGSRELKRERSPDTPPTSFGPNRTPSSGRPSSLRRFLSRRNSNSSTTTSRQADKSKRGSFCEIYVPGYGNGLNEVIVGRSSRNDGVNVDGRRSEDSSFDSETVSVSRESSNASGYSSRSTATDNSSRKSSEDADEKNNLPDMDHLSIYDEVAVPSKSAARSSTNLTVTPASISTIKAKLSYEAEPQMRRGSADSGNIHFNNQTWGDVLTA